MTSRDFCYWLQGYFELQRGEGFTVAQSATIRRQLAMVFKHEIDPSFPKEQQAALDAAHRPPIDLTAAPEWHSLGEPGYVPPPVYRC
jgi:hypothetical protein